MRLLALTLCLVVTCQMISAENDIDTRRKQLNDLVSAYWEYSLKQSPNLRLLHRRQTLQRPVRQSV